MRDVGEERLLAAPSALDLARHLVERRTHLGHLARPRERDTRSVIAAGEPPDSAHELAKWTRDRSRQQGCDEDREAEGDEAAERERRQERAQRVGEDRSRARDDDESETARSDRGARELLPHEDPLLAALGELAEVRAVGLREDHVDELPVAVDDDAPLGRGDDEASIGRLRLFGERVDDLARLLARAYAGLDRRQERRGKLAKVQARLVVLVPNEETRDRDRGHGETDEDDRQ